MKGSFTLSAEVVLSHPNKGNKLLGKMIGPDGPSSWVIAVACCFINMMMYGMTRLSGVLFVASVPRYHVNREAASFPYTFANFVRNTAGPLVGYLGDRLGVRVVTTFGCLLAAIGVGTCFLAENISTITVLWGTIFGLGFGLGNILLPVKINQYFVKYRATASGISFSGACLGSFILPPIVEILMDFYGLSGTFLILAGFVLNCVPAALLLRKPDWLKQSAKPNSDFQGTDAEKQSITSGIKVKLYTVEDAAASLSVAKSKSAEAAQRPQCPDPTVPLTYDEKMKRLSTETIFSNYAVRMSNPDALDFEQIIENAKGRRKVDQTAVDSEISNTAETDPTFGKDYLPIPDEKNTQDVYIVAKSRTLSDGSIVPFPILEYDRPYSKSFNELYVTDSYQTNIPRYYMRKGSCHASISYPISVERDSSLESFSIIFDPIFLLIAITNALYCFTFVCMMTVIVDFARDINVGLSNEKYILMSLSVGDLIGRLGLGWVTDSGYMTRSNFAAVCFLFQCITTTIIAWSTGFTMLVTLAALYGMSEAGLICIFPLIVAEFIEEDKQTVAIPCTHFLAGPLCLTVAPLIGYFRDDGGSYAYIFIGIGIISAACCIAWLLAPCILKCRKRMKS